MKSFSNWISLVPNDVATSRVIIYRDGHQTGHYYLDSAVCRCVRAGVRGDTVVIRPHHAGHRTEKLGTRHYTLALHRDSAILRSQQQQGWGDLLGFYVLEPLDHSRKLFIFQFNVILCPTRFNLILLTTITALRSSVWSVTTKSNIYSAKAFLVPLFCFLTVNCGGHNS